MTLSASSGKAQLRNSFTISVGSGRLSTALRSRKKTLPFLDMLLRRRGNGGLNVSVYRKPTDQYLHFESIIQST